MIFVCNAPSGDTALKGWNLLFVSRLSVENLVDGLNILVGLVGLWKGFLDWTKESASLAIFFPNFLFRATRTGPAFSIVVF